jgi:hypothetical protein
MTWLNPIAWVGLAAVGVPLLVHLLARRTFRRLPFPTLRFIAVSKLTPARQRRLTDVPLLLLRAGIIVAAVSALAQPLGGNADRAVAARSTVARAIVVDASASMRRPIGAGTRTPLDDARERARALATEAATSSVIETDAPGSAIAGAAAWLDTRDGQRELIVVSDFQRGAVAASDFAALPDAVGISLIRMEAVPAPSNAVVFQQGDATTTATVSLDDDRSRIEWRRAGGAATQEGPTVFAGPDDAAAADALVQAARRLAAGGTAAGGPVAIVLARAPSRVALAESAGALDQPWMFDVVDALRRDRRVVSTATAEPAGNAPADPASVARLAPVVTDAAGRPRVLAGAADVNGRRSLLLLLDGDIASPIVGAVIAGLPAPAPVVTELEPVFLADAALETWARPAGASTRIRRAGDASDGRWLWLLALGLLAVEGWMRRAKPAGVPAAEEVPRARVA